MSITTLFRTSYSARNIGDLIDRVHSIPSCGIRDPGIFCNVKAGFPFSVSNMALAPYAGAGTTLVITMLIFGLLCLDQARVHRLPAIQKFLRKRLRLIARPDYAQLSPVKKARRLALYLFLWILYITVWGLYIYVFATYFMILKSWPTMTTWTFGQIVAITVWVPVLFEYGNLEVCKSRLESTTVSSP